MAILTLWLLLGVPGVLIARRLLPRLAEGGILAILPVGYLASFALLSPLSIAGYLLHAPLWLLSAGASALVAAGLVQLARITLATRATLGARVEGAIRSRGAWVELGAAAVLLADVGLSALRGTHFAGDALFHVGRVRMLLDHGMNNWDPVIAGPCFAAEYHTNLYHALIASSAQLTGTFAYEAWVCMLPWAKLLIASCSYSLAYSLFERRSHAWLAALFTAVFLGPYSVLPYPNTLAGYFVLGQGVTLLVQLLARGAGRAAVLALAALSLVGAELHMLYAVFLVVLLGPVLGIAWLRALRRSDTARARLLLAACLALGTAAPFVWVAKSPPEPAATAAQAAAYPVEPPSLAADVVANPPSTTPAGFTRTASGSLMLDPLAWTNLGSPAPYLVLLLLIGTLGVRRSALPNMQAFRVVLAVLTTFFAWLMIPAACSLLERASGAPWIVARLTALSSVYLNALFPGLVFGLLGRLCARVPVQVLACAATLAYANQVGVDSKAWPRKPYLQRYATGFAERDAGLRKTHAYRAVLARNVPRGSTVLTEVDSATRMTALWDCHALAIYAGGGSRGVRDMRRRRLDVARMLDAGYPIAKKVELLRYYGLTQVFTNNKHTAKRIRTALGPLIAKYDHEGPARVFTLDLDRHVGGGPRGRR